MARNQQSGTAREQAIEYGIDVTLLDENLRRSPQQRIEQLLRMWALYEAIRPGGSARARTS